MGGDWDQLGANSWGPQTGTLHSRSEVLTGRFPGPRSSVPQCGLVGRAVGGHDTLHPLPEAPPLLRLHSLLPSIFSVLPTPYFL